VILFHGGWTGGTLAQFRTACRYSAGHGLVAATVEHAFQSNWALGFVLLMAASPLVLVFEVVTRFRYQGIGNGD
jgi:hypothetical protein